MAKYTIMMSCGHEDTLELSGNGKDKQRKIEYFESNGLCKECYKKEMEKREEAEGLNFNASVLPYIDEEDGGLLLYVWFSGNTKPHKDDIKSLGGYRWSERKAADDWLSFKVPMCWNKVIKLEDLQEEVTKAISIGANNTISDSGLFAKINYQVALDRRKKWKEKKHKIAAIEKPVVPNILKGHRWNQKIYGRPGNYSIYPDGEKTVITDEQAKEIVNYLVAEEKYWKKVREIERGSGTGRI